MPTIRRLIRSRRPASPRCPGRPIRRLIRRPGRGPISFRLVLTAVAAAVPLAVAGCAPAVGPAASAQATGATAGSAPATGTTATGTTGTGTCTADYCVPADWDTAAASAPLALIRPFTEPLNVVLSARSTVSLSAIQRALGDWDTVSAATTISVTGIRVRCISAEQADVAAGGFRAQQVAWRLDGCLGGNELSLSGNEEHVRFWHQPVPGSRYGAWFAAASYETMCVARDGRLRAVSANKVFTALHPEDAYHCVDGGPGSFRAAHSDGYDDGARDFAAAITAAARREGWRVSQRIVTVPRGQHAGEGGVPFSDDLYVLTVRS